jgi:flagellar biosynthesis anti-sigma factor FlgM
MAINNLNNLVNTTKSGSKPAQVSADVSTSTGKSAQEVTTNAARTATPQDAVMLTDQAQQLAKLQQKVSAAPSSNQSKVESLKSAIEKGEYSVDSSRVAKKMLDMESELDKLDR